VARGERRHAADVIGMLVGDEYCVKGFGRYADARKPRRSVTHAEAAVDHDASATRFDNEAVTLAAAADRRETHPEFRVT
jgi:hypothetical protein